MIQRVYVVNKNVSLFNVASTQKHEMPKQFRPSVQSFYCMRVIYMRLMHAAIDGYINLACTTLKMLQPIDIMNVLCENKWYL